MFSATRHLVFRLLGARTGLVAVIALLATGLAIFGGSVRVRVPVSGHSGLGGSQSTTDSQATGDRAFRTIERNKFFNSDNLINGIVKDGSFYAIMAVGATLVIISGGIDLSVGAVYCLAAVTAAMVLNFFGPRGGGAGVPPLIGVAAGVATCLGVACLAGLLNGVLITAMRVHPFVITLGTMQLYRSIALVISAAQPFGDFPPEFTGAARVQLAGLTTAPLIVLGVIVGGGALLLSKTVFGRHIYAIGGNETASLYSGLPVARVKLGVYTLAGFSAGIAALLALGYYGAAQSDWGRGAELKVIAACVVGGASLAGGRGTAFGTLLGTIVIFIIMNGIDILNIDNNYADGVIGLVIILAVALDHFSRRFAWKRGAAPP